MINIATSFAILILSLFLHFSTATQEKAKAASMASKQLCLSDSIQMFQKRLEEKIHRWDSLSQTKREYNGKRNKAH